MSYVNELGALQNYYQSGATRTYAFRKRQLYKLQSAVIKYEEEIYAALYADLKKSREETWVTENGILLTAIRQAIKNLGHWMSPERVATNLMNFPSSSTIVKEPLGVVLIIAPWNYPLHLLLLPLVGAIAAGNCVVLKPSEFAPATEKVLQQIIHDAFSPEYILCVNGEGQQVVPGLINDCTFDHIFFTGSPSVGKIIYQLASAKLIPVTLELGGKSPCVVDADADVAVAARRITGTKFSNAGQICVAPDYVLVHESVKDKLVEELIKCIRSFFGEDPSRSDNFCRIIHEKHVDRLGALLKDGKILHGGKISKHELYVEPTLIEPYNLECTLMREEIFGPLLPIISFERKEEALAVIQKNKNPLAFYVFTGSNQGADLWLESVPSGGACVNNTSWHVTNQSLPFGGRGYSGTGSYHGKYSFNTFSHKKSVLKTPLWFDPSMKYPPFKGKLSLFKWLMRF